MRFARASILLSAALGLAILTGCTASVPLHSTDVTVFGESDPGLTIIRPNTL